MTEMLVELCKEGVTQEEAMKIIKVIADKAGLAIKVKNKPPKTPFDFSHGQIVYFVRQNGMVGVLYTHDDLDEMKEFGNLFPTKEMAERRAKEIKLFNKLKNFAIEVNEGWEPDWEDKSERKWFCSYHTDINRWFPTWGTNHINLNTFFKSESLAQKAIDEILIPSVHGWDQE